MNEQELRVAIVKSGKQMQQVAAEIGVSRCAFYKKLTGKTDFTQKEIVALSACLSLSPDQIMLIFFS